MELLARLFQLQELLGKFTFQGIVVVLKALILAIESSHSILELLEGHGCLIIWLLILLLLGRGERTVERSSNRI